MIDRRLVAFLVLLGCCSGVVEGQWWRFGRKKKKGPAPTKQLTISEIVGSKTETLKLSMKILIGDLKTLDKNLKSLSSESKYTMDEASEVVRKMTRLGKKLKATDKAINELDEQVYHYLKQDLSMVEPGLVDDLKRRRLLLKKKQKYFEKINGRYVELLGEYIKEFQKAKKVLIGKEIRPAKVMAPRVATVVEKPVKPAALEKGLSPEEQRLKWVEGVLRERAEPKRIMEIEVPPSVEDKPEKKKAVITSDKLRKIREAIDRKRRGIRRMRGTQREMQERYGTPTE